MSLEYLLIFSFSFLFSIIIVSRSSEHNRRRIMVVLRSIMMMIVCLCLSQVVSLLYGPHESLLDNFFFFWLRQFSWLWILLTLWLLKVINFLGQTCWKRFFLHVSCHNKSNSSSYKIILLPSCNKFSSKKFNEDVRTNHIRHKPYKSNHLIALKTKLLMPLNA